MSLSVDPLFQVGTLGQIGALVLRAAGVASRPGNEAAPGPRLQEPAPPTTSRRGPATPSNAKVRQLQTFYRLYNRPFLGKDH